MEIIILDNYEEVCEEVGKRIISLIEEKPDAVLGLATGKTMVGIYKYLVQAYKKGKVDFSSVTTFNLDEYLAILPTDPVSFRYYMEEHFFKHVNISRDKIHIPSSIAEDVQEECKRYENKIKEAGGIDLQLLGIGRNGHIGFNEPTSSLQSRTRVKTLTEETLKDNFPEGKGPRFVITMGLGTIMEARQIILVASGRSKAEAIAEAVEGPLSASCPASVLQLHPNAKIIIDKEAARLLKRKNYYIWVYNHKLQVEKENLWKTDIIKVKTPGRICLFGEHQDYLGLPVISAAINLYMKIFAERHKKHSASFYLADFNSREEFDLRFPLSYTRERDYIRSVFNVLRRKGVKFRWGLNAAITSDIPVNAGASSSTALVVSLVKLLLELAKDPRKDSPEIIAELAYEAEVAEFNEPGGKMDHYTCAVGGVLFIDTESGKVKKLLPSLSGFVLGNSQKPKDTKGILRRVREGQSRALEELAKIYPGFDLKTTSFEEVRDAIKKLPLELRPYAEAAVKNREITMKAKKLLSNENFDHQELGKLLLEHHLILRNFLKISTPEIENMLNEALKAGALGGKINGSGGGGTMFVYAPGREEVVKEAIKRLGKPAYIVEVTDGVKVF